MGSKSGEQQSGGLGRQSSLYDLTLDEVQHQLGDLGKPLSSMNLDELLKSIWTAESNMNVECSHLGQRVDGGSSVARQSSLNLAQDLRKMTVDEVWQGIQQGKKKFVNCSASNDDRGNRERQPTLGEMTLEDFLFKAGIVAGSGKKNVDVNQENVNNHQQAQWMQYQVAPVQQQQVYMTGHHHPPSSILNLTQLTYAFRCSAR